MQTTKYPLNKADFESIYSRVPRLTVELIIPTKMGVLMTRRAIKPYVGLWHIPGGTVYYKEYLEDAVSRVAKNELGIEVAVIKHIGWIYYPNLIKEQGWDWPVGTAFEVSKISGEYSTSDQGDGIRFFKSNSDDIVPSQGDFLRKHGYIL